MSMIALFLLGAIAGATGMLYLFAISSGEVAGNTIRAILKEQGYEIVDGKIVPKDIG